MYCQGKHYQKGRKKMKIDEERAKRKLTQAEIEQLMKNREECQYIKNVNEGEELGLPKLTAVRKIIVDQDHMGAEDLTIGYAVFQPGEYHEAHAHQECEEFMYVISGRIVGGLGDGPESIQQAGDIMFMPRGVEHWFYNPFDEPQTHIFVYTRASLSKAGYSVESQGFKQIGEDVQKEQKKRY